jgi:hypothetical protein
MRFLFPALVALAIAVRAAPGEPLKTNEITLTWDPAEPVELIEASNLYYRTNLPPGMPATNAPVGEVMHWTPTDTNGWRFLLTVPGNTNRVTFQRPPGLTAVFFVITASNRLGESPFSNVAWSPAPPDHSDKNVRITAER